MLSNQVSYSPTEHRLALVKANLIPQLITSLDPLSYSFTDAKDLHISLINVLSKFIQLAPPLEFRHLDSVGHRQQQITHETVLKLVLFPSQAYLRFICANYANIQNNTESDDFMHLLEGLLKSCPDFQPTRNFILALPVSLTISSSLTFIELDSSIAAFLASMVYDERNWIRKGRKYRPSDAEIHRSLQNDGFDDAIEQRLLTVFGGSYRAAIVANSIALLIASEANIPRTQHWHTRPGRLFSLLDLSLEELLALRP
ncbi:hypothetical protein BLNAU_15383 [Blattamonas nauphoetae]|uniref:Uncharacterized protein n=1 Tax=Blattamonas nauphoetae TaxID=2049346 RepID=A0ABQ9XEF6_9EUKA|nr:hypothetical protein BLNAU_15383 [Blattamonas nauphoetae]